MPSPPIKHPQLTRHNQSQPPSTKPAADPSAASAANLYLPCSIIPVSRVRNTRRTQAESERGRGLVVATINVANEVLDEVLGNSATDRPVLDGSLTTWEAVPAEARGRILDALDDRRVLEAAIPEGFAQALGMYPEAPGSWLIDRWRSRAAFRIDPADAERGLAAVVVASLSGRETVATNAKMLGLRGVVVAGKISFGADVVMVDLLPRWPDALSDDERRLVEASARATFGAMSAMMLEDEGSQRLAWAKRFWRSNWCLYPCRTMEEGVVAPDAETVNNALVALGERVEEQWARFESAAIAADPDLFDPDRFEVLAGLVARSLRIVGTALRSPAGWTLEHSGASLRALVETLITITWLTSREQPEMYTQFKNFGRGRLKLLKLHWEEFADTLEEVPPAVRRTIDDLDQLVNQDIDEEFQNIDLGGSFSGIDTRKMAYEVGLEADYRLGFAPSSSDAHGEWGHLDRYVLTRCVNPTHRWHRVPRESLAPSFNPEVADSMLGLTERIVERFVEAMPRPSADSSIDENES